MLLIFCIIQSYLSHAAQSFLRKLTGSQLVKKFPAFYGTRRFINTFTSACHLFLFRASSIQSITPTSNFLKIHLNIILPSTPGSFKCFLSLRSPHENPIYTSPLPKRATCPAHLILIDVITRKIFGEQHRSLKLLIMKFSPLPCYLVPLGHKIFSSAPCSQTPTPYVPPSIWATKFHTHTKQQKKL